VNSDSRPLNPWVVAGTVVVATFMEVLDTSVANVALPHIAGNLSATVDESTWVLTSYLVANAIVLPLSGWFSSLMGRKRFYLLCVTLFTLSSMLCGMAPTLGTLILFRILQGLGGGAMQPLAQAILVESFPRHKQGVAMAAFGMVVVFAPIIGPTLGGWITDNFSWRWIFLINIPIGAVALLAASAFVHDPPYLLRRKWGSIRIDYIGLGLLSLGLACLEILLDEGQSKDWFSSSLIVTSAVIAAVALIGVVFWELRQKDPVVELHLLRDRNFAISTVTMFLLGFVLYGSTMLLPVFLQTLLGYTALRSGMVLSPGGIAVLLLMPLVGVLITRVEARWLVIVGMAISAAGLFLMSGFNLEVDFRTAMWARVVQNAGLAFLFVPINTMAFYYIAREKTGYATGLINLARNIGGSAGIALISTLLARRTQFHQQILAGHVTPYDPRYREMIESATGLLVSKGASAVDAAHQAQAILYGMVQRQAAMLAFLDAFWVMGCVFLAVIPMMFLMRKMAPAKARAAAAH
jgi:MFS transporter, DHA2 family, multidrug resistance protein